MHQIATRFDIAKQCVIDAITWFTIITLSSLMTHVASRIMVGMTLEDRVYNCRYNTIVTYSTQRKMINILHAYVDHYG